MADFISLTLALLSTGDAEVELGDGSTSVLEGNCEVEIEVDGVTGTETLYVLSKCTSSTSNRTVVVGRSWLKMHNPQINWETGCIHVKRPTVLQLYSDHDVIRKRRRFSSNIFLSSR